MLGLVRLVLGAARRTWLVTTITVAICAAFAAHAATAIIAADDFPPGRSPPQAAAGEAVRSRPRPERTPAVERNIFCSSCGPAVAAPAGLAIGGGPVPAVLIATEVAARTSNGEPSFDRATVRVVGTEVQGSWGVGDAIPGLGQLDRIGPMWIEVVDGAGHRGRLSLLDGSVAAVTELAPPPGPATPGQRWAGRLTKLSEQDYEVERSLVRELVSTAGRPGGVPMIPVFENGEIKGVRVGRVREDSIQDALGLKNGDVLNAINGAPIKTLDQLLDLYARLDQLSTVELSGTRSAKPLVRTLRLR
ncbi:MAG TPA: hypothetical protein VLM79_02315 [Kofleriaceae bacterium]|nr:hypothetical protein [Kofleriaceae bacterium]